MSHHHHLHHHCWINQMTIHHYSSVISLHVYMRPIFFSILVFVFHSQETKKKKNTKLWFFSTTLHPPEYNHLYEYDEESVRMSSCVCTHMMYQKKNSLCIEFITNVERKNKIKSTNQIETSNAHTHWYWWQKKNFKSNYRAWNTNNNNKKKKNIDFDDNTRCGFSLQNHIWFPPLPIHTDTPTHNDSWFKLKVFENFSFFNKAKQ